MKDKPRIIFFGTPDFAVASLEIIIRHNYPVVAVVTAPDKPAGRGLKLKASPVKAFAEQHGIPVLQPQNLKDPAFHQQLQALSPDLQVVVAFRMLPREVWNLPPGGTFNLHASLLPQYRGAAPINWALINGETETGVTTFFLDEAIDTGKIAFTEKTAILPGETAGDLHDRLMVTGAVLVLKTIEATASGALSVIPQEKMIDSSTLLRKAPKIHRMDCQVDWNKPVVEIQNLIWGLSPYPGAFTTLKDKQNNPVDIKIFRSTPLFGKTLMNPGVVATDGKTHFRVAGSDGFISINEIQLTGHKTMAIADFLNGFGRHFV